MNILLWLWRLVTPSHDDGCQEDEAVKDLLRRNVHETRTIAEDVRQWRESGIWQKDIIDGTYAGGHDDA